MSKERLKNYEEMAQVIVLAIAREKQSLKYYEDACRKARSEVTKRMFSVFIEEQRARIERLRTEIQEIDEAIEKERMKLKSSLT